MSEDILIWFVWFPLRKLVMFIPMKLIYLLGNLAGFFLYLFSNKRRVMEREVSFLFSNTRSIGPKKIKKIVARGLSLFCKRQIENVYVGKMTPALIERMVSVEGTVYLENALKSGKGVILLTAHFGSHLLVPIALGFKGYKVNQVAGPPLIEKQSPIHRKVFNLRQKESENLPVNFIVIGRSARPLFRVLDNNEILCVAFDGRETDKLIPVNFFGHKALFASGPFKLSLKTGAAILPGLMISQKGDTHRLIIEPPFEFETTEDTEQTLVRGTEKFAGKFEEYIRKYPCQYAMTLMRTRELFQKGMLRSGIFEQ